MEPRKPNVQSIFPGTPHMIPRYLIAHRHTYSLRLASMAAPVCPAACGDLTYVTHTPQINSGWGWYQGDSVCAECYVSAQATFESQTLNFGQVVQLSYDTSIYCSAAGTLALVSTAKYLESTGTYDQATGAGTPNGTFLGEPVYDYNVVHDCSNGTPDYNPSKIEDNNAHAATDRYFFMTAVMFRFSQTSMWSLLWPTGGATTNGGPTKASPPTPCTHTGPQK